MQRRWVSVAGLLLLSACRSGASSDHRGGERRAVSDPSARLGSSSEHEAAARTIAAMRATARDEIEMATIAAHRARASEVRTLAARILAKRTDDLDALGPIVRERGVDLRASDSDPMIQADLAVGRDALDRLAQASGDELDALYLLLEAPGAMRLSRLADQAERQAHDPESAATLRRIATQARDTQARVFALLPHECGGQRDVTPASGPPTVPVIEEPAGRGGAGDRSSRRPDRPRGRLSPDHLDL
jgi:predicted outer membrane protein